MYCDECKQKPATVHLTQMFQGQKTEAHLCESCAAKKGAFMFNFGNNLNIPHLLGSILGNPYDTKELLTQQQAPTCPECGMNFINIKQTGKLGCSECYTTFEQELEPTLRRINGNSQHVGKTPSRSGRQLLIKRQIEELKSELQQAVAGERYEDAVKIRDSIKELEKKLE